MLINADTVYFCKAAGPLQGFSIKVKSP